MRNYRLIFATILLISTLFGYGQTEKLNPYSTEYFAQSQIDTMSQKFIKAQNYIALNSWDIINRNNKYNDDDVVYKRDTVDVRPYLVERKENSPKFIYNVYSEKVIALKSKDEVKRKLTEIYSE